MRGWLARSLAAPYYPGVAQTLKDMSTWTELIGHAQLRSFVDDDGHFWLEQNAAKKTKWAKLARDGQMLPGNFLDAAARIREEYSSMVSCTPRRRRQRSS